MPARNVPTRFPGGIGTVRKGTALGEFGAPSPIRIHTYFNDFDDLGQFNGITDTASWDVTATGAGTFALTDGDGGLAIITNAAADDDAVYFQKKGEGFRLAANKQAWFAIRFKLSDVTQSDFVAGLLITDTTPLDVTDGVYFIKADGSAAVTMGVEKNNTATSTSVTTLTNDTFVELAWYYDGLSAIHAYVDGVRKGTSVTTNMVDDEDLTVSFGLQNGEAVAKTMTIDYVFAAKER